MTQTDSHLETLLAYRKTVLADMKLCCEDIEHHHRQADLLEEKYTALKGLSEMVSAQIEEHQKQIA